MRRMAGFGRLLDASGRSSQPHLNRRRRAAVRLRGPAPGLRGGRLGRSRAARGGGAAPARRARPRPRDPPGLRRRPAPRDARPRDRGPRGPLGWTASSPRSWRRCGSGPSSSPTSTASRPTPRSGSPCSSPRRTRAAAPGSSTPSCGARPARRARLVEALPEDTPQAAALRHSHPEWIAALWWETLGPADARALMAADNEPAEPALRANTLRTTAAELAARLPVASHTCAGAAGGAGARRALRRPRRAGVAGGAVHAAVARGDDRRAGARPAAGRARARPVRGAGRQDDPPGRADGGPRARSWRSSATAAAPRRWCARRSAWGRAASRCGRATRPRSTSRRPTTACSSTRPARTSARSPAAPTRAGARPPSSPSGSRAPRARSCARARPLCAPAARSSTRPARSRPWRTSAWSAAFLADHSAFEADDLREAVPVWQHPAVPRHLQTLPHRDGTEGFFIARLRRRVGS